MTSSPLLRIAGCGCGSRTRTYLTLLAQRHPDKFTIVAGADPVRERVEFVQKLSGRSDFQMFDSAAALLDAPRLADVLIIGTQDTFHFEPARRALEKGYDLLLEKPMATRLDHVLELNRLAHKLGRRVMLGFVLRFSPFYTALRDLLKNGAVGQIISFNASEGVDPWHQGHSFVRGHWARAEDSSPMIIAKSCHDLDILPWLIGDKVRRVSSAGGLEWFTARHRPPGATARCTDGCPVSNCLFDARQYATRHRGWLEMVYDRAKEAPAEEIHTWLATSPWGRCVYSCDNNVVDHQTVQMEFESGVTGTFTMTAFERGRHIEIYGSEAVLRAGKFYKDHAQGEIIILPHDGSPPRRVTVETPHGGYGGHGGGDVGLADALYDEMTRPTDALSMPISDSVHSHVVGFAAEAARVEHRVVDISEFIAAASSDDTFFQPQIDSH